MKVSGTAHKFAWVAVGSMLNVLLGTLDRALGVPLFLDSVFTAVVAALFGPLWGTLTAVVSQAFMQVALMVAEGQTWGPTFAFVFCQIVTALVIGFLSRAGRLRDLSHFVIAVFAVALGNSVVGSLVATYVFGGINLHNVDFIVTGLLVGGQSLLSAAFWARVPINLFDKGLAVAAGFLALRLVADLPKKDRPPTRGRSFGGADPL